jgi:hypothetical protein
VNLLTAQPEFVYGNGIYWADANTSVSSVRDSHVAIELDANTAALFRHFSTIGSMDLFEGSVVLQLQGGGLTWAGEPPSNPERALIADFGSIRRLRHSDVAVSNFFDVGLHLPSAHAALFAANMMSMVIRPVTDLPPLPELRTFYEQLESWKVETSIGPSSATIALGRKFLDALRTVSIRPKRLIDFEDGLSFYFSSGAKYGELICENDESIAVVMNGPAELPEVWTGTFLDLAPAVHRLCVHLL